MIALPLGTVLCFFDLLGARAFSRGEASILNSPFYFMDESLIIICSYTSNRHSIDRWPTLSHIRLGQYSLG